MKLSGLVNLGTGYRKVVGNIFCRRPGFKPGWARGIL
jgi:hypothetical protein